MKGYTCSNLCDLSDVACTCMTSGNLHQGLISGFSDRAQSRCCNFEDTEFRLSVDFKDVFQDKILKVA